MVVNLLIHFVSYDDNYIDVATQDCNGSLIIEAPEGWYIELSGTLSPGYNEGNRVDTLKVYDGADTNAEVLYEEKSGGSYEKKDIGICHSTGNTMTVQLCIEREYADGVVLTVKLVDPNTKNVINIASVENGSISSDTSKAAEFDQVTLTATPNEGYLLGDIRITDSNSNNIKVNGNWYLGNENQMTFEMPGANVNVTPTFINDLNP